MLANLAAGIVVGKLGTAEASAAEVLAAFERGADQGPRRRTRRVRIAVVGAGPAGSVFAYHAAVGRRRGDRVRRVAPAREALRRRAHGQGPRPAPRGPRRRPLAGPTGRGVPVRVGRGGMGRRLPLQAGGHREPPRARRVAAAARHRGGCLARRRSAWSRWTRPDSCAPGPARNRAFDVIVGADGAGSLVRRTFLSPTPAARRTMATGWFARGTSEMVVRFTPGLAGYLWLFPRRDHVGVGICAPLTAGPSRDLLARLESEVARSHPGARGRRERPLRSHDPLAVRGSAVARGDRGGELGPPGRRRGARRPITGEGIYYALRSARLLAETIRAEGSPARYPERVLADFGSELLRSARLHARFYAPGFTRRMVSYAARSASVRDVLGDLVLGQQGYAGLEGTPAPGRAQVPSGLRPDRVDKLTPGAGSVGASRRRPLDEDADAPGTATRDRRPEGAAARAARSPARRLRGDRDRRAACGVPQPDGPAALRLRRGRRPRRACRERPSSRRTSSTRSKPPWPATSGPASRRASATSSRAARSSWSFG